MVICMLCGHMARRAPGRGLPRPEAWRWRRASGAAGAALIKYGYIRQLSGQRDRAV